MHNRFNSIIFYSLVLLIGSFGCTEKPDEASFDEAVPADFRTFYSEFLNDSSYQMAHIAFPLQGMRGSDDSDTSSVFIPWQEDNWTLHRAIDNLGNYQQTFDILSDDLIVETIEERDAPIAMQRRFARMADGWHLIYYIEMQPMSQRQTE